MKRPRVQHVSLPRPPRSDEATRAFYGTLLGFEEIPAPSLPKNHTLIALGGMCASRWKTSTRCARD